MPIFPLPQFEADLAEDAAAYAALKVPKSIVVRFGAMKMVGEFPYDGEAKPGCGSKLVARTHRGTELCEMLTTTCPNSGCGKSVSRDALLSYIDNSGGKDYPFHADGRILRIATLEDMNHQAALEAQAEQWLRAARAAAVKVGLTDIKVVSAEPILGNERITFHFLSEERVDFRPLVMELAGQFHTRIEMHQVGARDEARVIADYERCGQHCCCKQFLKVLKPVSMKAAKTQKATLDPLKISGRCGRLMCCLRYEENTYDELKKNLPRKKTPIMTPDGPGIVIDTQILTQLVLVRLDATNEDAAYAVEVLKKLDLNAPPAVGGDDDDAPGPAESTAPPGPQQPGITGGQRPPLPQGGGGQNRGGGGQARDQRGPGNTQQRQGQRHDNRPPQSGSGGHGQSQGQRRDNRPPQGGPGGQGQRRDNRPPPQQGQRPNQPPGQQPGGQQGQAQPRPPMTEEERARKRTEKLIPRSDFREPKQNESEQTPPSPPPSTPPQP
ncbi:MAG: regulatory iron-sulfur-containing complex subunit RicT [Phycisphaerales bacterium]|nr:regulatory iron-sulfur-containing complex subunit RicT [Phycisphaerales bacterium]